MSENKYPSWGFLESLEKATQKLRKIGQGKEVGKDYERIKRSLIAYAHTSDEELIFDNQHDIRRVLSVLIQEVSHNHDVLQMLIEKSKFNSLFKNVAQQLNDEYQMLMTKKMLNLYYSRYFYFEYLSGKESENFYNLLKRLVSQFDGKSILVLKAQENKEIIDGDLHGLIQKYGELNKIHQELAFLEHFEIWQRIRIIFLLEKVKKWQANQWDKEVESVLEQVLEYKNVVVGQRNLLEETAFLVLQKCKSVNNIIENWENFLIKYIGDPRILRYQNIWLRIGEEYYRWLREKLSKDDVRAFLENMTDGQGDEVYQYRRQFWLQYIDYVQYAKVMLGNAGVNYVAKMNPDMYQRFKSSPEIYSHLNDSQRSCIFIDFGSFYVIEGTHSAKLRFYKETPISLNKHYYDYDEFYVGKASQYLSQDFTHHHSENYSWQNQVRRFIIDHFQIEVKLEDIVLDEDKYRLKSIQNYLFNRNQSII